VADGQKYWVNGVILWKPEDIKVPVLLIKAEWELDTQAYMAQNLSPKLTGAPYKRCVALGQGTHTIIREEIAWACFARCSCSWMRSISMSAELQWA